MMMNVKKVAEMPKLSCLQAKKRPSEESSASWGEKRTKLEKRKESFVTVTAVNNFAKFVSFSAPPLDTVERAHTSSVRNLDTTLTECNNVENEIRNEAHNLITSLEEFNKCQQFLEHGETRLEEISARVKVGSIHAIRSEEDALSAQLRDLEAESSKLEDFVEKCSRELHNIKEEMKSLATQEKEQKDDRQASREIEGPERERISLLSSFVKVKRSIHEKLSGHQVVSIDGGRTVRVALREESVTIDLSFDETHRLVDAVSSSILTGSRKEQELRDSAVAENDPSSFVRTIKMLVHNACMLQKELVDLRAISESSKRPFELEYNASKRILLALFNRGAVYAKLRVPLDYMISPVELLHLEKPDSAKSLKPVAQRVQEALAANGKGSLVSDWVVELNSVLL